MSFSREKSAGWVAGDKITADQINGIDRDKALAVDGTNGGEYTLASKLSFKGTGGVEIAGTGDGLWPLLSSRTVTRAHQLEIALATDTSLSSIVEGDLTSGSYSAPELSITNNGSDNFTWVPLRELPDGGTLGSLSLVKKWSNLTVTASSTMSSYDIVRWTVANSSGSLTLQSLISAGATLDTQSTATYSAWNSYAAQTLTCDQNNIIDTGTYRYALIITHPVSGILANTCHIVKVSSSSTVTKLQS